MTQETFALSSTAVRDFQLRQRAIYIKGPYAISPTQPRRSSFSGSWYWALEGYDAIQTAVCAYIVVPVVNE